MESRGGTEIIRSVNSLSAGCIESEVKGRVAGDTKHRFLSPKNRLDIVRRRSLRGLNEIRG
jgi:hypothetical protein